MREPHLTLLHAKAEHVSSARARENLKVRSKLVVAVRSSEIPRPTDYEAKHAHIKHIQ